MNLKQIIEESDKGTGRLFDVTVQALVLLSLISFSIETLPDLSSSTRTLLRWIEITTVGLFTVEYALRILVADNRRAFFFSFFGFVDLIAILPFYVCLFLPFAIDLRSIRVVRFLRIFRILKLARYSRAIERFRHALQIAREELLLFSATALILLYIAAVGIYFFERNAQPELFSSIFHSLWWSIVTLTTVGYGDVYPITLGGQLFTSGILVLGLGVVAVPTGLLASALSKARELEATATPATRHREEPDSS